MPLASLMTAASRRWRISALLIGLLLSVFLIFLTAISITAVMLYHHESALRGLFAGHFERAMLAGELARDAEVLNAQIFERMLGNQKSVVDGQPAVKNQMSIFQNSRDKLTSAGATEELADIDRLQREYFSSVQSLEEKFLSEEVRQKVHAEQLEALLGIMRQLDADAAGGKIGREQLMLAEALHALLAVVVAAENDVASGQLSMLEEMAKQRIATVHRLLGSSGKQAAASGLVAVAGKLESISRQVFARRGEVIASERATLASARETRVIAQRLGGAAVNHYLALRAVARQEMDEQAAAVHQVLLFVTAFIVFTALVSLAAIVYIVRRVAWRLRDLNVAMRAHVAGEAVAIPQQGDDEIAEMGKAFEVFVNARDQAEKELRHNQSLLAEAAVTDSLSGLPNRRGFDETFAREWRHCARSGEPLAVVMADIDFFKAYNDRYGHLAGDECIRRVAAIMRQSFDRAVDYPARFGGEEFICILPATAGDGARYVAERFRQAVAEAGIPHADSSIASGVTISVGVASTQPNTADNPYDLVKIADEALYRAKEQGRNCVVLGG